MKKNENLIKIIFDMFIDENTSMKIRYMLSHLIWILLYDNQTLKTALNKKEYIQEIKNLNIHLQKEYDMIKYNKQYGNDKFNNEMDSKLREDDFEKNIEIMSKNNEDNIDKIKEKDYFENTCLNLRKILHILEI